MVKGQDVPGKTESPVSETRSPHLQKSGLSAILGEPESQNPRGSLADIATHARIFYYAQRIGVQIDFAHYHTWLARHPDHQPPQLVPQHSPPLSWQQAAPKADLYVDRTQQPSSGEPNYPMGFAEMLRLLNEGKPIPGIRQIPNTIARDPVSLVPLASPCPSLTHVRSPSNLLAHDPLPKSRGKRISPLTCLFRKPLTPTSPPLTPNPQSRREEVARKGSQHCFACTR